MNKKILRTLTAFCAALMLMGGFSVTAFAQTPEQPAADATNDSGVIYEEPEETAPLTPEGNATLVDDFGGNKQLIAVTTKAGNYFYILIGKCPRCGSPVHEGKKNYYCSNRNCAFVMWKNDRFFEDRKVAFSPKIAAALLKSGKVKVKGLYSPKTGKTYDGTVILADTGGKYVNYKIELPKKK